MYFFNIFYCPETNLKPGMRSNFLRLISAIVICSFIITTCKKDHKTTEFEISEVTITDNTVKVSGKIISLSDNPITGFGVCYSTKGNPVATDTAVNLGTPSVGPFSATITNLKRNTTYYFRAFIKEANNYLYDDVRNAVIPAIPPSGTSMAAGNISESSATLNGSVNPNGCPVNVSFEYGETTSYGKTATPTQSILNGNSGTSVSVVLASLSPNTVYHFRVTATSAGGTAYGEDMTFRTKINLVAPVVISATATNINNSSATLNASVNPNGSATKVTFEYGTTFLYGTMTDVSADSVKGFVPSNLSAELTGLTPGQLYHFRIKAVSAGGTANSDDVTFTTTKPVIAATVETVIPSLISALGAASGGNITNDGGGTITDRGVCWNTTGNPSISDNKTAEGSGAGYFTSNVTALTPGTHYFLKAYATNSAGTAYGNQVEFTTMVNNPLPATLTTVSVTEITSFSATGGGNISADGGSEVVYRGVCYSSINLDPTIDDSKTINGTGIGEFSSPFTGLAPNTLYNVRAYATNASGTVYGNRVTFTSAPPPADLPSVTTGTVTDISSASVTASGDVISDGGGIVTERGVCWSLTEIPTISDQKLAAGSGTGGFTCSVIGLNPGTVYYLRAYAKNSAGTAYGNQVSFTTSEPAGLKATLTTTSVSAITASTAATGGNITDNGGAAVTSRGVCWGTAANPTVSGAFTDNGSGIGSFPSYLSGLSPNTTYYVRAFAVNSAGVAYGNQVTFNTLLPDPVPPTVTTTTVGTVSYNSATGGGNVTNDGYATVTERGICWSTSENPTVANSKASNGTGTGSYTASLSGLSASTTYYVRAYAVNSSGTSYGSQVSFTTSVLPFVVPTLTTADASSVTNNSATTGGSITDNGGATITVSGVCYGISPSPTIAGNKTTDGSATGSYPSPLTGLSASTTYYVRAYATNVAGTGYGNQVSFTTLAPPPDLPAVSTTSISGIGTTVATSGGNVTYGGTSAVTSKGICWGTSINPTTGGSKTTDGSGTGIFTSSMSGLIPCTTYHVRAYATNSTGTSYGPDIVFATLTALPSVSTTPISGLTSTSANSGGNITGDCMSGVTARGIVWNTSTGPTIALATKTLDGTGGGVFSSTLSGLTPCTVYYVRSYATNGAGTVYGNEVSFTTSAVLPSVTTAAISGLTTTSAGSGGTVTGNCLSGVTDRGIVWNTSPDPTIALVTKTTDGAGGGSYASSMTGLNPCTVYYVRAYATNSAGTAYGNQIAFTTSTALASVSTTTVSSISSSAGTSGGNVTGSCAGTVYVRGICWSTSQNPTTSNSYIITGSGAGAYASSMSGLTYNTTYYVRAFAINTAGTVYGDQVSFTTLPVPPTVSTNSITIISALSTAAGGNITNDGGAAVSLRGVCWNTTGSPTADLTTKTTDGSGIGTFISDIPGLTAGATYYVRAYATNSGGTGYGNQVTVIVPATITDYNGNIYNTVTISGQTWMQENLKATVYNDGSGLMLYSDTMSVGYSYYHSYNNVAANGTTYGYMYNGFVIGGTKNICPVGWHVATSSDWTTLAANLGGSSLAGGKMKDLSEMRIRFPYTHYVYSYWDISMSGHSNESRFYGRGGGYYLNSYVDQFSSTVWWVSNKQYVRIYYNSTGITTATSTSNDNAFYIRCKKN